MEVKTLKRAQLSHDQFPAAQLSLRAIVCASDCHRAQLSRVQLSSKQLSVHRCTSCFSTSQNIPKLHLVDTLLHDSQTF